MRRRGFTVIEVTVTVVVLAVLGALSVGAFSVYRQRLGDGEARHSIETVMGDARARYESRGAFLPSGSSLAATFPGLTLTASASSGPKEISYAQGTVGATGSEWAGSSALGLAVKGSARCYMAVVIDPRLGDPVRWVPATSAACSGPSALALPSSAGRESW